MVKVEVIARADPTKKLMRFEKQKFDRIPDSNLHPFLKAREYQAAVTAAKMESMFSKPFVRAYDAHREGVCALATHTTNPSYFASGDFDGVVKIHDCNLRTKDQVLLSNKAHEKAVTETFWAQGSNLLFSTGRDGKIVRYDINKLNDMDGDYKYVYKSPNIVYSGDFQPIKNGEYFVTGEDHAVKIWNVNRSDSMSAHECAPANTCIRFSKSDPNVFIALGNDRVIYINDIRLKDKTTRKVVAKSRSNEVDLNPRDPFIFTVASDDWWSYTFDLRKLTTEVQPTNIHKEHAGPVMTVAYHPLGTDFCTGSFDQTLRVYSTRSSKPKDTYFTKRMRIIRKVRYSCDGKYVFSASDDHCVRIWKAEADAPLKMMKGKERRAYVERKNLVDKWRHAPEVHAVAAHKKLPKRVFGIANQLREKYLAKRKKEDNVKNNSKPGEYQQYNESKERMVDNGLDDE